MLWRKLLAVVGVCLAVAQSISAQDLWRTTGTATNDAWKPSPAILGTPTASPSKPVSTYRNVQPAASLEMPRNTGPVRFAEFDDRMPVPDTLPPYEQQIRPPYDEKLPAPKTRLDEPKAVILNPVPNRYPGVPDGTGEPLPGFDPLLAAFRPRGQVWLTAEYLFWGTSGMKIPPIATSSPVGTSMAATGVIGLPTTHLLFGGDTILNNWRSGVRVNTGFWCDDEQLTGVDMTFFYLGTKQQTYSATSAGDPLLARPFYDASTNMQNAQLVTFATRSPTGTLLPTQVGIIGFRATNSFWGADFNFRKNLWDDGSLRVDGLFGFKFLQLRDMLNVGSTVTADDPTAANGVAFGTNFTSMDSFQTRSDFYGGQVGLKGEYNMGRWSIGMVGKLALGDTYQAVAINGSSTSAPPGGGKATTSVGGLFAQNTNIGTYSASNFSVAPEININLSYQLTQHIRIFGGYSILYWSNVARAGNQIDYTVNSTQIATGGSSTLLGPARPAFIMHESGFWANGINIGLEFRW
jgi:hypothetical protein